ncbi:lipopolysaccharide assembly protein LapB [Xanthomonadaceae bacterium JHOS43]|nr:lipopolysaccharide assembly protein LapB [Xanthomonadaceae bacterium JHOS43]MCX7563470.1 lipopolysaccharide assembly protein LapB [Xanthomonadaceae bacterium XH05]
MSPVLQQIWWVFALLPVAALSGWFLGRRSSERHSGQRVSRLSSSYFRGLNFLLNEQPDKAIEVFLQIADVDKDTVETHFALGNLFRRRGEVERAIRVHQNLVERPNLTEEQRLQAVLELGEDFMRAGLLDRAESLFADLGRAHGSTAPKALHHLIWIYQQERDWAKAIDSARRYEAATGEPMGKMLAQFHCELAEAARSVGDSARAAKHLRDANEADSHSVRAGIIEGRMALDAGDDAAAIRAFERVARHDVDALPEVLEPLLQSYERNGARARSRAFLSEMIERSPGISPVLALANLIEQDEGVGDAARFLTRQLRRRPSIRGQNALIDLSRQSPDSDAPETLKLVRELSEQLVASATAYRCGHCGFGARAHHWQCPSCKRWATVKPVHGAFGE